MPKQSYKYKAVKRFVGKALHKYDMIADKDRVLVGLSGGKDSLTLMWALNERRARIPIDYELFPVYIDPGFEGGFADELADHMSRIGTPLRVERTHYGILAHSDFNRENPCFLCARLRRKRLFEIAEELGCNKLALGHHKDDIIETLLMNMFYAGEISTMIPSQVFFKGLFTLIRPLALSGRRYHPRICRGDEFPEVHQPLPQFRDQQTP